MTKQHLGLRLAAVAAVASAVVVHAAGPVSVSDVKAEVKTSTVGASKGKDYLRVAYNAQVSDAVEKLNTVIVKASCKAGDKVVTDQYSLGPAKLDAAEKGSSKPGTAVLFMKEGLPAKPSQCTLNFLLGKASAKGDGAAIKDYCWEGGAAKEGACK